MKRASRMQTGLFDGATDDVGGGFVEFCHNIGIGVGDGPGWADRFGVALRAWARTAVPKPIRTLSLFSGVGGLDIAFHDAGFAITRAVEIDERFAATLRANAGASGYLAGTDVVCQDIRQFHSTSGGAVDFIIGGPPCQSFSAAGRRAAGVAGTQDVRGVLFQEYVRLLTVLRPTGFLFENVYGITGAEGGKAWESIRAAFAAAGYQIASRLLDTADYGVPQHRERMFIVGVRTGHFQFPRPTHGPDAPDHRPPISAAEAIAGCELSQPEKRATVGGRFGHLLAEIPPGLNYSYFTEEMKHPEPIFAWRSKFSDFLYKADPHTPIRTLKAQGGQYTGPFHWKNRPFGLAELKRLQTIPDVYQIVGRRQVAMHQIGNSVPPQIARILALSILSQVFHIPLPSPLPVLEEREQLGFRTRKRQLTEVYRAKAAEAIEFAAPVVRVSPVRERREYRATLGHDFSWVASPEGALNVACQTDESTWAIDVANAGEKRKITPAFEIAVTGSSNRPWALGATQVVLRGYAATREVFVGAWKAFESELVRRNVKADLVQLCEYYQYSPRFTCELTLANVADPRWQVLAKVVDAVGTREILSGSALAARWEVRAGELLQLAVWLRSFGYEARNNLTNSLIAQGSFLIPYAFPTLTPLSVQLRKKMAVEDG